jgi:hypothetical protein
MVRETPRGYFHQVRKYPVLFSSDEPRLGPVRDLDRHPPLGLDLALNAPFTTLKFCLNFDDR